MVHAVNFCYQPVLYMLKKYSFSSYSAIRWNVILKIQHTYMQNLTATVYTVVKKGLCLKYEYVWWEGRGIVRKFASSQWKGWARWIFKKNRAKLNKHCFRLNIFKNQISEDLGLPGYPNHDPSLVREKGSVSGPEPPFFRVEPDPPFFLGRAGSAPKDTISALPTIILVKQWSF